MKPIICKACNGNGLIRYPDCEVTCPVCGGAGELDQVFPPESPQRKSDREQLYSAWVYQYGVESDVKRLLAQIKAIGNCCPTCRGVGFFKNPAHYCPDCHGTGEVKKETGVAPHCQDCTFFVYDAEHGCTNGVCHRYPVQVICETKHWCGEFKAKE